MTKLITEEQYVVALFCKYQVFLTTHFNIVYRRLHLYYAEHDIDFAFLIPRKCRDKDQAKKKYTFINIYTNYQFATPRKLFSTSYNTHIFFLIQAPPRMPSLARNLNPSWPASGTLSNLFIFN